MNNLPCNSVGIDVSKGKSTIAVMRPLGEIVKRPFEIRHSQSELKKLADILNSLEGDVRIVMEYTGKYYQPIARFLYDSGFFVSVVHAKLIHDFANNSIRNVKTDKADALKIANYGITHWNDLRPYSTEDDTRILLKAYNRQCNYFIDQYIAAKNRLIGLMDQVMPGVNELFHSPRRPSDGHTKWIDFAGRFWHCSYITGFSLNQFTETYVSWCKKNNFIASKEKAKDIYSWAKECIPTLPKDALTKQMVKQMVQNVQHIAEHVNTIQKEMDYLASSLPEHSIVMDMYGVGHILGAQLMAEIGDVRRFAHKSNLVAYAGLDAPPYQSGAYENHNRHISKRGSTDLRRVLFLIVSVIYEKQNSNDPVFQFMYRKRSEGKPYYVYIVAGCNKFLRIYYARVKEHLNALETA